MRRSIHSQRSCMPQRVGTVRHSAGTNQRVPGQINDLKVSARRTQKWRVRLISSFVQRVNHKKQRWSLAFICFTNCKTRQALLRQSATTDISRRHFMRYHNTAEAISWSFSLSILIKSMRSRTAFSQSRACVLQLILSVTGERPAELLNTLN